VSQRIRRKPVPYKGQTALGTGKHEAGRSPGRAAAVPHRKAVNRVLPCVGSDQERRTAVTRELIAARNIGGTDAEVSQRSREMAGTESDATGHKRDGSHGTLSGFHVHPTDLRRGLRSRPSTQSVMER